MLAELPPAALPGAPEAPYCLVARMPLSAVVRASMEQDSFGRLRVQLSASTGELWVFSAAVQERETGVWFANISKHVDSAVVCAAPKA